MGLEITEKSAPTLAGSLLSEVDEYRSNHQQLSEHEQIDKWLALLKLSLKVEKAGEGEQYEHFDSHTQTGVGVRSTMMVMPMADKWHLLNNNNAPKSEDILQNQAVQYLFSNLNSDDNSIKDLLEKLEKSINKLEDDSKPARLRSLYKMQKVHILSAGKSAGILNVLNKQLLIKRNHNEVIKVPNLVQIVGKEKTIQWLKQALVIDKVILDILKGTETYTLAKNLALELSDQLKAPQWKLAQELNSIELYQKMDNKFSAPGRSDYNLRSDYENAFAYYFISHVVNNNVEQALEIIKSSYSKNDFKISKDIFYDLEKNGYSEQVWDVLDALLHDNPVLPLWGSYFKVSASLDKTRFALNKIADLLKDESFSESNKASLQQYYIKGLLSVGDTSKAIPLMRENIAGLSAEKRSKAAVQLAKLAHLLGDSDALEYALGFVVDDLQQNRKKSIVNSIDNLGFFEQIILFFLADSFDHFDYKNRELIGFLREIGFHEISQQYLIRGIEEQVKKIEEDSDQRVAFYSHNMKSYAIELMGIYYDLGRWVDIKLFMDNFSYWGVDDVITLVTEEDSRKIPLE